MVCIDLTDLRRSACPVCTGSCRLDWLKSVFNGKNLYNLSFQVFIADCGIPAARGPQALEPEGSASFSATFESQSSFSWPAGAAAIS